MAKVLKNNRIVDMTVAIIVATVMGLIASLLVYTKSSANVPPFPIFCLLNMTESILVALFLEMVLPLKKLGVSLAKKMKLKRASLPHSFIVAIPYTIGNSLIISACVSFFNITQAYYRAPAGALPPLFVMWFSSWYPILVPMLVSGYLVSVLLLHFVDRKFKKEKDRVESGRKMKRYQAEILIVFAVIIVGVTVMVNLVVVDRAKTAIRDRVSNMIAANSRQIELNINSYLERMETMPTLLFSEEYYYGYDATDSSMDEYDKIKSEEAINNRIVDIGLMNNYSDFVIVYADDHKVGWISQGTQDMFTDESIYEFFSNEISESPSQEAWCFGIGDNTDRIYYIKRINKHAVLVSSIHTRELSSVFVYPEQLGSMSIRLADKDGTIIYSSDISEVGGQVESDLQTMMDVNLQNAGDSVSVDRKDVLVNMNLCSNGWRVICSVPTEIVLEETVELQSFAIRISALMVIIFVIVGLLFILRLSAPMDDLVMTLQYKAEVDRLSGAMNKLAFQEAVGNELEKGLDGRYYVFVMMDMDNFKQVNDSLGHSYGDQVIIRFGQLLSGLFGKEVLLGRLGGDEFAAFYAQKPGANPDPVTLEKHIREGLDKVLVGFKEEFEQENRKCNLSVSAGVYMDNADNPVFSEVYERADRALYESKRAGKSRYTFYRKEDEK